MVKVAWSHTGIFPSGQFQCGFLYKFYSVIMNKIVQRKYIIDKRFDMSVVFHIIFHFRKDVQIIQCDSTALSGY